MAATIYVDAAGSGDTEEVAGGAYTGEILEAYTAASPSRAAPRAAKTAW
ncbi:hypothetical protein [Solidesulfovibrio sp.]|nr:hypothetical protein [Solidesulfovibrio sp.]